MPTFSNILPSQDKHMGFDLRRTDSCKPLLAIVTSDDILVTETHFWGGRTVPHEAVNCPACLQSQPYRTHVYVSAIDPATREHFIFECTSNAAKPFQEYREAQGSLRGCFFKAHRPKQTKNGKVVIITRPFDMSKSPLPIAPDLIKALCVIWQIPYCVTSPDKPKLRSRSLKPDLKAIDAMREQPANSPDPIPSDVAVDVTPDVLLV